MIWRNNTYFETFSREGYKKPGYSKDGKFKEDQIVIGRQLMKMGYRYIQNISRKCYWFKYFIPFMLEIADIYEVNSVTIIADKGMSVNRNIRF